jgi:DMSO reductase anchor subunit
MKERSLVAFTLLAQMAAGAYWTLAALHVLATIGSGLADADGLVQPTLLPLFLGMILALSASVFHLGNIGNAWRACANLRSSWLSREILFALLFTLCVLLLVVLSTGSPVLSAARSGLAWMNLFFSLGLVWSMAGVYRLRTVPAWNIRGTALSFFITAALLGTLCAAVLLSMGVSTAISLREPAVYLVALLAAGALFVQIVWLFWQGPSKQAASVSIALESASHKISRQLQPAMRLGLALASAALLALYFRASPESPLSYLAIIGSFLAALASEVFGRALFYTARIHANLC